MMINKICPVMTIGLIGTEGYEGAFMANCRTDCAWYNSGTDQCAIFGIFDQTADVAQRVDELRDVVESGVKVFNINE